MPEETISHYRILGKLGEGGMGVVYRALDTRLERTVALKLLPRDAVADPERRWRFEREAKAASSLNHPNIVTIYDIDRAPFGDGEPVDFIAMECVEGEPLDRILSQRRLTVEQALDYAVQMASALAAAHAAGIVHRDIKPGNVIVSHSGQVKVLDFGLAKLLDPAGAVASPTSTDSLAGTITAATAAPGTKQGAVLGTLAYMSPEQAQGKSVDARSDVFSLGCVLYEMFSGRRPFQQDSNLLTLAAILRDPVPPVRSVRPDVPPEVDRVVARSLEKEPEHRYPSAVEMRDALAASRSGPAAAARAPSRTRRPGLVAGLSLLLVAALGALGWYLVRESRMRRAREAVAEIPRLIEAGKIVAAVRLARATERSLPEEVRFLERTWAPVSVTTEPPGARVSFRDYLGDDSDWEPLGLSPVVSVKIPFGYFRWRISKDRFQTVDSVSHNKPLTFRLDPPSGIPPGMVRVAGGNLSYRSSDPVPLADFWLDKYEVTNKQFKDFVDHGGYQKKEYWKEPFVKDGKPLSWEEAMTEFKDSTGRPAPATWELGTYPEGRADYPVSGVSWYEAAAYAEFSGKSPPTIFHWYKAAEIGIFSDILKVSNFGGQGPARVGTYQGLTAAGAYDMAGNVREWCRNEAVGGRRYILGGAWSDPGYLFSSSDAQLPFDRSPINGIRCARYTSPVGGRLVAPVDQLARDYSKEIPVSDETY
ncbi:MAG TPA: bifunctional serine/threonine-protein kinase/formylglycine-generating enzyme family protein, partial [Thermoanaerobaculia bacterium]|nr:bifunctional serine/threonine-protein kinase/formylglycine-generating enzyme family protein [Thermoanaerobaculia bacterium]